MSKHSLLRMSTSRLRPWIEGSNLYPSVHHTTIRPVAYTHLSSYPTNLPLNWSCESHMMDQSRHMSTDTGQGDSQGGKNNRPVCPRCGEPFKATTSTLTLTRFLECTNCQHFYLFMADSEEENNHHDNQTELEQLPSPKEMYEHLDSYVVGQTRAKKVLSVAMYNHYKRIQAMTPINQGDNGGTVEHLQSTPPVGTSAYAKGLLAQGVDMLPQGYTPTSYGTMIGENKEEESVSMETTTDSGVRLDKSNIILLGPTGCGKTLLAQCLAKYLDVPMVICDCTTLTQAGYVGDDIESVIIKLLHEANFDVSKAQRGIIFLDEVDKISCVAGFHHLRDVGGEGVQQGLLKILEGTTVHVPEKSSTRKSKGETITVDTTNILFVASGAFNGLDKIVARRNNEKVIGFGAPADSTPPTPSHPHTPSLPTPSTSTSEDTHRDKLLSAVESRDLMSYGMIPEFVGRFPILVSLESLDKDSLVRILTEPTNALVPQYTKLFEMDKVELEFSEEALDVIAEQAQEKKTGARGLKAILETILLDPMFEVPRSDITSVHINKDTALGNALPTYKRVTVALDNIRKSEDTKEESSEEPSAAKL
ncbi:ATP-dependent Clp protease ATP-binding subunit ClpX-like [Halichondria panicea]|uniref:ATP-dependent Clp protease ATP-binding subunit ClpX-like n=1 Tax=Halichondria panicea TaxID=6063 RepID=UPI00312BBA4A